MPKKKAKRPAVAHPELPTPDPELSVFINCPFDSEYEAFFDAIVFSTVCCGFIPRCAMESESTSVPRMDRIAHGIFTSNYSIHDLTRCRGEGDELYARFNMPLELGLAMGRRLVSSEMGHGHEWLVLVPDEVDYVRFVSDLGGFDPKRYDGQVKSIVPRIVGWLTSRPRAIPIAGPTEVVEGLRNFREMKVVLKQVWASDVPWNKILEAAQACVPGH